jgi:hypothetical protein
MGKVHSGFRKEIVWLRPNGPWTDRLIVPPLLSRALIRCRMASAQELPRDRL